MGLEVFLGFATTFAYNLKIKNKKGITPILVQKSRTSELKPENGLIWIGPGTQNEDELILVWIDLNLA